MKIPQKIYVALSYGDLVRGYMAVADKEETKYCQKAKDRADINAGRSKKSMYITNTACEGFRVIDYTTDGMLIEHPDGFSFYISPRNMYDLIRTCTIKNGEIDNKLYFDNTLTLISEVSEILSDAISAEETLKKRKELLKSFKFNDIFYHNNKECVMIGRYHFLLLNSYGSEINSASKLTYVFYETKSQKYYASSEPLPSLTKYTLDSGYFTESQEVKLDDALTYFKSLDNYGRQIYPYVGVSTKPIKKSDIKTRFVECSLDEIQVCSTYPRLSAVEIDGVYKFFNGFRTRDKSPNNYYRWGSDFEVCNYDAIDSKSSKYYCIKDFQVIDSVYSVVEKYSEKHDEMQLFKCPVNELDLKVGYLEIYL